MPLIAINIAEIGEITDAAAAARLTLSPVAPEPLVMVLAASARNMRVGT